MTTSPAPREPRPVAVGFDGTTRSVAALEYAAAEAARRKVPLRVIHVSPALSAPVVEQDQAAREIAAARRAADESAALHARRAAPDVEIDVRHRAGAPSRLLLEEADGAQLVVLGREHKGVVERAVTGATTASVVCHASVPIVVVPAGWTRGRRGRHFVVVGVKGHAHADGLLEAAFGQADELGAEVRIVEAELYADAGEDRAIASAFAEGLTAWRDAYPDVRVRVDLVEDAPVDALVRASVGADLLLVQRRKGTVLPPHLGRVARAVLAHAPCPVEVVPAMVTTAPLELERGGALLR